jgi:hypothetical protein
MMRTRLILPTALVTVLCGLSPAACGDDDEPNAAAGETASADVCDQYTSFSEAAGVMFAAFETMGAEELRSTMQDLIGQADELSESTLVFAELRDGLREADRRLAERDYDVDQPRVQDPFDSVQFEEGGQAVEQWAAEACGIAGDDGDEDPEV